VNSAGDFVGADIGAALDLHPLHSMANTASTLVSSVADGLPTLNLGMSSTLDSLVGGHDHSIVDQLGDLTSIMSGEDIGGDNAIWSLRSNALTGNLSSSGALEKLSDASSAMLPDNSLDSRLPVVSAPTFVTVSDSAHISIVGEATAITPGHSIEFAAPVLPEGDVLFRGNNYTDYHVALQSTGPSAESNSIPSSIIGVVTTPDATALAHVDTPAINTASSSETSTAQHQDAPLSHLATTLDDLSLRSHPH